MKPHKYMTFRGRKWTIIRKVPSDISEFFGKKQIWKSLKTTDLAMANSRYPAALAEIEAEFEKARLYQTTAKPASLDTVDIEWIAQTWFEAQNQTLHDNDIGFATPEDKIERISEVGQERTMWLEDHAKANLGQLQSIADGLLRKTGLPTKPLSVAEKKLGRKKPYLANVDKTELKYHHFVQLIRRGLIELCERELELLGVKVDRTPLVNLYRLGMGKWARAIGFPFTDINGPIVRAGEIIDVPEYLQDMNIAGFRTSGLVLCDQVSNNSVVIANAHITNLEEGWAPFIAQQRRLYPKFFKKIARLGRKLNNEHSEVVFTFDDKCPETFHQLIAMKREQYARTNLHDVLRPSWVNQMLDMLRHGECKNISTKLSTLCVDGMLVAAEFNMQSSNLLHGWLTAYNPEFSKYSPGLLLTQHIIKAMPQHGLTHYDAGCGNSHYKKYFTNQLNPLGQGPIFAKTKVINPIGIVGAGWSYMETHTPFGISSNLAKIRRRSDQIIGTETMLGQRVLGFSKATLPFL